MSRVIFVAVASVFCGIASAADQKLPRPSPDVEQKTVEMVREAYQRDYSALSRGASRTDLAKQLIQQSQATRSQAEKWALLVEALRLAGDSGDTNLAFTAMDSMSHQYDIDKESLACDTLTHLAGKVSLAGAEDFSRQCLAVVRDADLVADNSEAAQKLLALAAASARKSKNVDLQAEVARASLRAKDSRKVAKEIAAIQSKLRNEPENADLNLQLGSLLCFKQARWREGSRCLVKGSDPELARLACLEAESVQATRARVALADGWWEWAKSQKGTGKQAGLARAATHYAEVINEFDGLERARLEGRLAEAADQSGGTGELLFLADLKESAVVGASNGFSKNGTFNGIAYTCRGKPYPKAVFAHPPDRGVSKITFRVPPGVRRFRGSVGVFSLANTPPTQQPASPLKLQVLVDGEVLWASPALIKRDQVVAFDVDVRNGRNIELQTQIAGSANTAWGAWLDPVLVK